MILGPIRERAKKLDDSLSKLLDITKPLVDDDQCYGSAAATPLSVWEAADETNGKRRYLNILS